MNADSHPVVEIDNNDDGSIVQNKSPRPSPLPSFLLEPMPHAIPIEESVNTNDATDDVMRDRGNDDVSGGAVGMMLRKNTGFPRSRAASASNTLLLLLLLFLKKLFL